MGSSETQTNQPSCTNKRFSESCHLLVLLNRRAVQIRPASDPARCDEEGGSSNASIASAPLGHLPVCCGCRRTQNTQGETMTPGWKNALQTEHPCSTRCCPNQQISNNPAQMRSVPSLTPRKSQHHFPCSSFECVLT